MNMPDMPVNVPVDDPNADTEWNDILRKHGVIPEKPPSPTAELEEVLVQARALAHEHRLEGKDLDELAELEDDEDDDFLEHYRRKRLAEMSTIASSAIYNQVYPLQKPDYSREVTEASSKSYVVVLLTASLSSNAESRILEGLWKAMAEKFGDVKFCQIRADMCIEGYPEKNTPTILIYKDGDIKRQIVTLRELQGTKTSIRDLERVLVSVDAVKPNDLRLSKNPDENEWAQNAKDSADNEDDGSDWD
ncbi:thioredoxin-like protein [Eremomyces bilateralis CBS 781.70]|uniref:Thioredoxin-like protein n=1 Tax=Eremomyces bilateralis CBS 781.70 TaxID=1392243 RepID=A0A6G1G997_9PEZI|nr:thioredoxin-like protein [Eremomyces bilateralis CBS 781.70]KAF1814480.1 thioredoxin-like protein [Eremomyces bilateralis CBS 781.70]